MARRGENISKRKDGRWEGRYVKSREPSGKIKYGYCYGKTYREAKQKLNIAKRDALNGSIIDSKKANQNFGSCCDAWLEKQKHILKQSSFVKYELVVRKHIKPALGEYKLCLLDNRACEMFRDMLGKELSPKSVRDVLTVLKAIIQYVTSTVPSFSNKVEIVFPKQERQEMRVLSVEEQKRFIGSLMENLTPCNFGILLALMTGMRIGEVCALQWRDVSIKDRIIKVHSTMQRLKCFDETSQRKTSVVVGSPKSEKSIRVIPIICEMAILCEQMNPHNPDAYILTGDKTFIEPRTLQYRLKRVTDVCGIEGVHFHTLRHTFATRCVEVGFEIKSLSEILGHANTTITLDRYVHSSLQLKRENMEKLSNLVI